MHDSSIQNVFNRTSHDLICDPIGIVVILIIVKVPAMSDMLGSSAFLCLAVAWFYYLLHTYRRTDGLRLLFCCCGQVGSEEEGKKRKERWRRTLHLPGGLLLGYVSTPSSYLLFPGERGKEREREWRFPQLQLKRKKKPIRTNKNTLFYSFPIPEISRSRPRPRQPTPKPCSSQRISPRTRNQILDVRTSRRGSFCGNSSCCETSR